MGGSARGDFGKTYGSVLDAISNILAAASLIPGVDTFADLASVPVDLMRGDYVGAGLSAIGAIPVIGEVADAAKAARIADNVTDAVKAAQKAIDAAKVSDKVRQVYAKVIEALPKDPKSLLKKGWVDSTPAKMLENTTSKIYSDTKTGIKIRFDKGEKGADGFRGKNHYHVFNPNSTGKHDYYLDKNGNPVPKNSKSSHIIP